MALLRIVQLLPWPVAVLLGDRVGYANVPMAAASYVVQCGWGTVFTVAALRRGAVDRRLTGVDVAVAAVCLVAAGRACQPLYATSWANSAVAPAMGAAAAGAVAFRLRSAIGVGAVLAAAYVAGVGPGLTASSSAGATTVGNVLSLAGFGAIGGLVARHLAREAESVDAAVVAIAEARSRTAAERARYDERGRQYRLLHDTVLSTLSAIARGGLDHRTELVRQRCAADADYLRGLISGSPEEPPSPLAVALAAVGRDQAALGVRVHHMSDDSTGPLPDAVVEAFTGAAREALNNVAKHSGAGEAWLTVMSDEGTGEWTDERKSKRMDERKGGRGVTVTVVDRGVGFDPGAAHQGLGLARSIVRRMAEVGGVATVDSGVGEGTSVALRWPAPAPFGPAEGADGSDRAQGADRAEEADKTAAAEESEVIGGAGWSGRGER